MWAYSRWAGVPTLFVCVARCSIMSMGYMTLRIKIWNLSDLLRILCVQIQAKRNSMSVAVWAFGDQLSVFLAPSEIVLLRLV